MPLWINICFRVCVKPFFLDLWKFARIYIKYNINEIVIRNTIVIIYVEYKLIV